jgi:hypothetical protein
MHATLLVLVAALGVQSSGSGSGFSDSAPIFRGRRPATAPVQPSPRAEPSPRPSDRGFHQYEQQISDLFKQESKAASDAERAAAIRAMCDLHGHILRDSRYALSPVLKEYRGRLWSRLTKVKTELKQELARDARANQSGLDDLAGLESADRAAIVAADSLSASLALLDQSQGGPGSLLAFGGGAGPPDNGAALVALIERTINPAFWDTIGGPGSIVYYAPLQCLVVRATAEVHGQLGGALGGLRGAR